jgi:peptidoglycan/LPS O-acetylase OafA/YrhL
LDVLRAMAVFFVMCTHCPAIQPLGKMGWIGVDLFFVLSGFLISGLLFSEFATTKEIDWKRFLIRRAFKIYPPFYFFLALTVLIEWVVFSHLITRRALIAETFFFQNYFSDWRFWGHTWSLAVEEHFYLLLPMCLMLLIWLRRGDAEPLKFLPHIVFTTSFVVLLGRTYSASRGFWVYSHTHARVDALASGVAFSWFWHFRHDFLRTNVSRFKWLIIAVIPILISPALFWDYDGFLISSVGLTAIYIGFTGLLAIVLFLPVPPKFVISALTPVASVGIYSYSIYLWHVPVQRYLTALGFHGDIKGFLLFVALSLLIGIGMSRLIETPSIRMRDKLFSKNYPARAPGPRDSKNCTPFKRFVDASA